MSSRKHFSKSERYECGAGAACSVWWAPIAAAAIGGGLGLLSARQQARSQEQATERSQDVAREMAQQRMWPYAEPYAEGLLSDARGLYQQQAFAPGVNPLELQGRQNLLGYSQGALPQLVAATHGSFARGLNPGLDPYVPLMIEAAQRDLFRDYNRNVLPRIRQRAQAVGGFGGSRQGVAEGIASEGLLSALGDVSTRLLSNAYGQNLQQQRAAWEVAPQMALLGAMPAQAELDVGAMYRSDPQQAARNLQGYAGVLGPYTGMTSGGQVIPYQVAPSSATGAVQGAATGLGLYNMWQGMNNQNRWIGPQTQLGSAGPGTSGGGFLNQGTVGGAGPGFLS